MRRAKSPPHLYVFLLFYEHEAIENYSAVFADEVKTYHFGKLRNFDAIGAYGMNSGIGMTAGFTGFYPAFFAKMAAAGGKDTGIFAVVTDFLHRLPKELASALMGNLLADVAFPAGKIRAGIFLRKNENVFEIMELGDKRRSISHRRRAHIAGMIHSAEVLFAKAAKGSIAGNKPCGDFGAIFKTYGFGKFFYILIHGKISPFDNNLK